MIKAILVFNNHGKPRLSKFYQFYPEDMQQQIIRETFQLVSKRDDNVCNFLEGGSLIGGSDYKLIYRHYATLYFVFCVDSSESELGILDLIQESPHPWRQNEKAPSQNKMASSETDNGSK
ncbi:AP-3 complex subunit sigma-2 [Trichonephila clavipes]|nr:AP-3 complex subunit sigma-2 [Trichonephila clavipes]